MDDIHDEFNLSMEQTRWLLKRVVDGETTLVADLIMTNPFQLLDVTICAASMLKAVEKKCPEVFQSLFAKELPN